MHALPYSGSYLYVDGLEVTADISDAVAVRMRPAGPCSASLEFVSRTTGRRIPPGDFCLSEIADGYAVACVGDEDMGYTINWPGEYVVRDRQGREVLRVSNSRQQVLYSAGYITVR